GGLALLDEVGEEVGRGAVVEVVALTEAVQRLGGIGRTDLPDELAQRPAELERATGPVAVPERHLPRLSRRRGDDDTLVGDLLDAPGRGTEQERLARPALVDHLLVQLADPGAVGEEDSEHPTIGVCATTGLGE